MTPPRPALQLPEVPHVPGRNERPPDSLFAPLKSDLSLARDAGDLASSHAFKGGLGAFSRRYYWEAHELWEAVWIRLPPASAERHLLRGLIQLANAGLKARMGRENAVRRIRLLAGAALTEAFRAGPRSLMGLTRAEIANLEAQIARERANPACAK